MNSSFCPNCNQPIAYRANRCHRCGWKPNLPATKVSLPLTALVVSSGAALITGSCAFRSYAGRYGDEFGYGRMALLETGILLVTVIWLAVGLSVRSEAPKSRKLTVIRASTGVALGVIACCLALSHFGDPEFHQNEFLKTLLLGLSGIALFMSCMKILTAGR